LTFCPAAIDFYCSSLSQSTENQVFSTTITTTTASLFPFPQALSNIAQQNRARVR
jgi:hypothetical protein